MSLLDVALPDAEVEDHHAALEDLAAVSLVTREVERERFSVHRLVQDVTRRRRDAAASGRRLAETLGWVNTAFDGDPEDVRNWPRLDPLAPHARSVIQWAEMAGIKEPTAWLMNQLGLLYQTKALDAQAEPLYRRHWRSTRRPSDSTIPTLRETSTISPNCCEPHTGWARRNR
jgi:hypothetical protein